MQHFLVDEDDYLTLTEQAVTYALYVNVRFVCHRVCSAFCISFESVGIWENTFVSFQYSR